jgi:hypothetical protein
MVGARREDRQQLGVGGQPPERRIEHGAAHGLGERGAAGLARGQVHDAAPGEQRARGGDRGALSRPLPALERDEQSASHRLS